MGVCAEKTVTDFKMTRQHLDDFTVESYNRVIEATKKGLFKDEIAPVTVDKEVVIEDEEYKRFNKEKLANLKPVFNKNGTITAANSSKINDGACAIILMS
jgi:acetyl-CoA C-acetyltransferase